MLRTPGHRLTYVVLEHSTERSSTPNAPLLPTLRPTKNRGFRTHPLLMPRILYTWGLRENTWPAQRYFFSMWNASYNNSERGIAIPTPMAEMDREIQDIKILVDTIKGETISSPWIYETKKKKSDILRMVEPLLYVRSWKSRTFRVI